MGMLCGPWDRGGCHVQRRPQPNTQFPAREPWVVITKQLWDASAPAAREEYRIVRTFRGWGYNAGGKIIDLIVARRQRGVASDGERPK